MEQSASYRITRYVCSIHGSSDLAITVIEGFLVITAITIKRDPQFENVLVKPPTFYIHKDDLDLPLCI
jgi:hypothetical protein